MRPFIGRFWTSACETVPAIWLRAASSTVASPVTVTLGVDAADRRARSAARTPSRRVSVSVRVASANPCDADRDLVRADLQVRKPETSLRIGDRLAVDVGVGLARGDLRAGDDGALRIGHASADAGVVDRLLRADDRCRRHGPASRRQHEAAYEIPSHC